MLFSQQREKLEEYCSISGIQGFKFLTSEWSPLERVIWSVILVTIKQNLTYSKNQSKNNFLVINS